MQSCYGDVYCHQPAVMTELSPGFVDGEMCMPNLVLKEILKSHTLLKNLSIFEHVLALSPFAYLFFPLFSTDEDL